MRIVQLANFYSPTSGGIRVTLGELRVGYVARGHEVTLIVPGADSYTDDGVIQIASPMLPNGSGYRLIVSRRDLLDALDLSAPDLLEVHDKLLQNWVWSWARKRSVPMVAVTHERLDATLGQFLPRCPGALRDRFARFVSRRVVADCDALVACSSFAAAEFPPSDKLRRIPLGVDLARFRPATGDSRHAGVRLISVGRLSAEKRPDIAIATLAELRRRGTPAELTILGCGPWEGRLRRQARQLPVRFTVFLDRDAVAESLATSDVALATGPAETFGLAALEAMACGTAVVAVRGAATAEFSTQDRCGGRAVDLSAVAFADAVGELIALPRAARRQAARSVAERYSWDHTVDAFLRLHADELERRGRSRK